MQAEAAGIFTRTEQRTASPLPSTYLAFSFSVCNWAQDHYVSIWKGQE